MKAFFWVIAIWLMLVVAVRLAHCEVYRDDFDQRLIHFNQEWGKFYRAHFGCPQDATNFGQCNPNKGINIYDGFPHVAHEAMKLFSPAESK